jgi:hypothetical protein
MDSNENEKPVKMYVGLYAVLCALFLSANAVIHSIFSINIGRYAIPFIVGVYIATRFIKARARLLNRTEKVKLITGTFFCTVLINVLTTHNLKKAELFTGDFDSGFFLRQVLILLLLCLIFGPVSTYIYDSSKK